MNILEVKNLSYSYDKEKKALDNISIEIKKGSVTAILGGNGAGKSTLFLTLNGVLKLQSGDIYFDNEKMIFDKKGITNIRRNIGIVFQNPNDQLFSANVRSDIAFGIMNIGMTDTQINDKVEEFAKITGVFDFLDRSTHSLSYGQKKRVAIAGVLIMQPKLLILDEPTAGLDPKGITEILALLLEIKENTGISIIISTHDIDIVPLYCDYAYILSEGVVALKGTPKEIFEDSNTIRSLSLRTPRILHLMQILKEKDNINIDQKASTISQARASIKKLFLEK